MGISLLNKIEDIIKKKKIREYEILLVENDTYETIFKKNKGENEREIFDYEYTIRTLNQKVDGTGIGIVKGCSSDSKEIEKNIDICASISKSNSDFKYEFPQKRGIPEINIVDELITNDPLEVKSKLTDELISEIEQQKDVLPTFGRVRIHCKKKFLRNHNGIDLKALKTFIFVEFSLKAQSNGKLSEYWLTNYFKEISHFNIREQVEKWTKLAKDTLIAKLPKPTSKAVIIFPPHLLREAINPVIGYHILGKAHNEKNKCI
ncbi:MAG: hypothetical protein ACFE8J_14925 [Candidatus Heimdallarchaeota archaeon]